MVNCNLVKRGIRFRLERSDFHRAFGERIFARSYIWSCWLSVASCQPHQRNEMPNQSLWLVTSLHLAPMYHTLDNLFIYKEEILYKQEEAFWR